MVDVHSGSGLSPRSLVVLSRTDLYRCLSLEASCGFVSAGLFLCVDRVWRDGDYSWNVEGGSRGYFVGGEGQQDLKVFVYAANSGAPGRRARKAFNDFNFYLPRADSDVLNDTDKFTNEVIRHDAQSLLVKPRSTQVPFRSLARGVMACS